MNAPANWWSTFFNGVALDVWRRAVTPEQTKSEADFIERRLGLAPGARILDVPCGNGRIAIELAARGHRLEGIDIATEYVAEAQASARARSLDARFRAGDMREIAAVEGFDGAYCFGNSFAYLDDEGNARFLERVARALKPGARFVLETGIVAESVLGQFERRAWYSMDGVILLAERRHDPRTSRLEVVYTFLVDGKLDPRPASYRVYTLRELCGLLEAAGFASIEALASTDDAPYETGSRDCILIAARAR
jgi:SAM-dependent methyltransferase